MRFITGRISRPSLEYLQRRLRSGPAVFPALMYWIPRGPPDYDLKNLPRSVAPQKGAIRRHWFLQFHCWYECFFLLLGRALQATRTSDSSSTIVVLSSAVISPGVLNRPAHIAFWGWRWNIYAEFSLHFQHRSLVRRHGLSCFLVPSGGEPPRIASAPSPSEEHAAIHDSVGITLPPGSSSGQFCDQRSSPAPLIATASAGREGHAPHHRWSW